MAEQEGVIKFQLNFERRRIDRELTAYFDLDSINHTRGLMLQYHLIGRDPERYQGLGFGNLSVRHPARPGAFLISGSQTGGKPVLEHEDLALVIGFLPQQNQLTAVGLVEPSSEAMTHGAIYAAAAKLNQAVNAVIHVHSPELWRHSDQLSLPGTAREVPYGSTEMVTAAQEVTAEILRHHARPIFVMQGHEDGVVAFGTSLTEVSEHLLELLQVLAEDAAS
jgi:ribulose-5-phosphate 4-epimerase/fuculose-1-phosphate aldolase